MKITPSLPTPHTVLITAGTSGYPSSKFQEIGEYQAKFQPSYQQNATRTNRGEVTAHGPEIPVGRWFCLEWENNDNPNQLTIWVDGEQVEDAQFTFRTFGNTNLVGGFTDFGFGARVWGTPTADLDVYYDDLAIGTQRIGMIK